MSREVFAVVVVAAALLAIVVVVGLAQGRLDPTAVALTLVSLLGGITVGGRRGGGDK